MSSARSIKNLTGIVKDCKEDLFIVISAFGKTTNNLETLLSLWYKGSDERFSLYNDIINYHYNILRELFPSDNHSVYNFLRNWLYVLKRNYTEFPEIIIILNMINLSVTES